MYGRILSKGVVKLIFFEGNMDSAKSIFKKVLLMK